MITTEQVAEAVTIMARKIDEQHEKIEYLEGELAQSLPYRKHFEDWIKTDSRGVAQQCKCGGKCGQRTS